MAGDNIMKWLLLGGAAYIAYEYFFAPATASATTATTGTTTTGTSTTTDTTSTVSYVPPSLTQQLQTLAGNVTQLNADQWNYYYTTASPQGLGQPSPANFMTIFFPNGRPTGGNAAPTMTAAQFVAAIGNPGLSGYQGYKRAIPVPTMYARGFGRLSLGDLRNAGRR